MSDATQEVKQFAPGEKEAYDEVIASRTRELIFDLDDVRPSFTRFPQGYEVVHKAVNEMPYYGAGTDQVPNPNPKLDAFCARVISTIVYSFALRINEVGFRDEVPGDIDLHSVDLSAANDAPVEGAPVAPDDEGIRRSYMDNAPELDEVDDEGNSEDENADRPRENPPRRPRVTDRDVARHGDHADQRAIDEQHAQSREADREIAEHDLEQVLKINSIIVNFGTEKLSS